MTIRWFRVEQEDQPFTTPYIISFFKKMRGFSIGLIPFNKFITTRIRYGTRYKLMSDSLACFCAKGRMRILKLFHFMQNVICAPNVVNAIVL